MTLQLRVGGVYRNRKGEKVEIEHFDRCDTNYPYTDSKGDWYTDAGNYYISKESPRDLIAEWDDKPTTGEHMKSRYETNDTPRTMLLHDLTPEMLLYPNPVGPQPDPRVVALEGEVEKLKARVAEVETELTGASILIGELRARLPQPKVESVWWLMGRYRADLFKSLEEALGDYSCEGDILVRYDTITAPTGEVSYKCEVVT